MTNRIIKFRAWDGEGMSAAFTFNDIVWDKLVAEKGWAERVYPKLKESSYILMQFTGLKDKNGKEVFEGDVVKNKNLSMHGIVEFGECANSLGKYQGFYIKRFLKFGKTKINNWENPHWEIIGNIYENPELLK